MSWFGNLAETYDRVAEIAGKPDKDGNVLLPKNHTMANTNICVTIDGDGRFRSAEKSELKIMIPCTEDSASRANSPAAHSLHENMGYLALDATKSALYLRLLSEWSSRHPKVAAVYKYVAGGTLLDDLNNSKIEDKDAKVFIRFRVIIPDDNTPELWLDARVSEVWREYVADTCEADKLLCYVSGQPAVPMVKHPKGVHMPYNAKLISCNDDTNYTYRGRFTEAGQANAISAESSHKAHAMLKYLIQTQGYKCDTQAVVAWALEDGSPQPSPFSGTDEMLELFGTPVKTDNDTLTDARDAVSSVLATELRNAIGGYGGVKHLKNRFGRRVAVAAVDSATTGRMGITFYQDLSENDYINRVVAWHETCSFWFTAEKKEYVSTPAADKIIEAVYGKPKGEGYKKIKKQARERLLHYVVCGEPVARTWISAAAARVSRPFSYDKKDGGWDKRDWQAAVNVTCALVRKFYTQKGEEISLELDKSYDNRSYLFGRLLALADRIESHARYLQTGGKNDTEKRPTNAVRYMSAFSSKPFRTWSVVFSQLNPYIQRLDGAEWYQKQIDEVMSLFKRGEFDDDKPVDGRYLLGYSLQRRDLQSKEKNDAEEQK